MFAGPNGSGKTTLTNIYRADCYEFGTYVNPDVVSAFMRDTASSLTQADTDEPAQRAAISEREQLLAKRKSLTYETVFSHPSHLHYMARAREAGYQVRLVFVGMASPEVCIARVAQRVATGGHDVPPEKVRERYFKSIGNLLAGLRIAHDARVYDNTIDPVVVAEKTGGRLSLITDRDWFRALVIGPMAGEQDLDPDVRVLRLSPPLTTAETAQLVEAADV